MTVLIGQSQATKLNGIYMDANGNHTHSMQTSAGADWGQGFAWGGGTGQNYAGTASYSGNHTHTLHEDSETRTNNFTYKIWVRTA